ncbi:methyltransferase domain-containing protein [Vibrio alginolyticus]|nr:methyltransferase domain-containing protein [Vibrio alginolyticus]
MTEKNNPNIVAVESEGPLFCEMATIQEITKECTFILEARNHTPQNPEIKVIVEVPNKKTTDGLSFTNFKASDVTAVTAILSLAFVAYKYLSDRREENRKLEKLKLEDSLKTLYGPLKELREESKRLYEVFALDLKEEHLETYGERFRTLTYLRSRSPKDLPEHDREILNHIVEISKKNVEFIEQNGWAIESPALSTLLGKLCAHFRVMEVAAKGKLIGAPDELDKIVFPLETDGAIDNEINRIQHKIQELSQLSQKSMWSRFMNKVSPTTAFYNENADAYYLQTNHIDMSATYKKYREYVKPSGRILDAGCGVGRDTRYFISKGYKVQSFDISENMCKITNSYPFSFCKQMSFLDVDYYEEFDGVWANASLLHLNKNELAESLRRLVRALTINGVLFASFKTKDNYIKSDKREFYFHTYDEISDIIEKQNLGLQLLQKWKANKNDDPSKEAFESYIWKRVS